MGMEQNDGAARAATAHHTEKNRADIGHDASPPEKRECFQLHQPTERFR